MTTEPIEEFDTIIITIHLPVAMDYVVKVLEVVTDCWPAAELNTHGPGGWRIDVGSEST